MSADRIVFIAGGEIVEIARCSREYAPTLCALRGFDGWAVQTSAPGDPLRAIAIGDAVAAQWAPGGADREFDAARAIVQRGGVKIIDRGAVDAPAILHAASVERAKGPM